MVAIPVTAFSAIYYAHFIKVPLSSSRTRSEESANQMFYRGGAPVRRLDARFADANNDLVADAPANGAVDPDKLVFSFVANENAADYAGVWKDFTDHLSRICGKPVEYGEYLTPMDELRALRDGKLHVAGFNTGSVPLAVNLCGFVPAFSPAGADEAGVHSVIIVPASSAIASVPELRGHTITFTDPTSNSGCKAPRVALKNDFQMVLLVDYQAQYSFDHYRSIKGIAENKYDAAAVASDLLQGAQARGMISPNQYRTIYKSEQFPAAGIGYAYNLKPELVAKIREAFETFDWKGSSVEKGLSEEGRSRFVPVNYKSDWALIRRVDELSGQQYHITEPNAEADPATAPAKADSPATAPE